MSKLYNVFESENPENDALVSKMYVDVRIKALEDSIKSFIGKNTLSSTNTSGDIDLKPYMDQVELLDVEIIPPAQEITTSDIVEDSNHRFLTDAVLETIKDKPSKMEVEQLIENTKKDMDKSFNALYTRLLNMPNAVSKLKEISSYLENDADFDEVLNLISKKISVDDLTAHIQSNTHMNNQDRKALNYVIKFMQNGIDWNANKHDPFAIKNKPESMKANGGNCDTVDNLSASQISRNRLEQLIIGIDKYNKQYEVDILYSLKEPDLSDNIKNDIPLSLVGIVGFKPGVYKVSNLDFSRDNTIGDLTLRGSGNVSELFGNGNAKASLNNIRFQDVKFNGFNSIIVNDSVIFDTVEFEDCTIIMDRANLCKITNCRFTNCKIICVNMINTIITNNVFINTTLPRFVGNNTIANNVGI